MQSYQIFVLDELGRQIRPQALIFCEHDREAIARAGALAGGQVVELWDGGRMVMRIEPERPDREHSKRTGIFRGDSRGRGGHASLRDVERDLRS